MQGRAVGWEAVPGGVLAALHGHNGMVTMAGTKWLSHNCMATTPAQPTRAPSQAEGQGVLIQPEHIPLHTEMWGRQARALQRAAPGAQQLAAAKRAGAAQQLADLERQPPFVQGGAGGCALHPHQLVAVNWLRRAWARGQHAIFADDMVRGRWGGGRHVGWFVCVRGGARGMRVRGRGAARGSGRAAVTAALHTHTHTHPRCRCLRLQGLGKTATVITYLQCLL